MTVTDAQRNLISRLRPADVPEFDCADCSPSGTGAGIEHAPECPVALTIEAVSEADKQWLDARPDAPYYYRPVTWAEGIHAAFMDERLLSSLPEGPIRAVGRVRVMRVRPGVRSRALDAVRFEPAN